RPTPRLDAAERPPPERPVLEYQQIEKRAIHGVPVDSESVPTEASGGRQPPVSSAPGRGTGTPAGPDPPPATGLQPVRIGSVARKKPSSSEASPWRLAYRVRASSSVPVNRLFPLCRIRRCVQRSSTSESKCELTITAAPAAARSMIDAFS